MNEDIFKEYIRQKEPDKRAKGYAWHTAVGLQAVDGLKPSAYLLQTAVQNIEGEITIEEAKKLLDTYYEENPAKNHGDRTEEADKVSVRIAELLSERAFSFTPNQYLSIHRKLFSGIYSHAGKIRDYNITKKEWVLDGATVVYGSASELTLGFHAENDCFAENAWYFRNALVRANYNDLKNGVHETTEYLELFLKNVLLDEKNELHNRAMHISGLFSNPPKQDIRGSKQDIEGLKQDIGEQKQDIDIKKIFGEEMEETSFSVRTVRNIEKLYLAFGNKVVFGRTDIMKVLGITASPASALAKKLLDAAILVPVREKGKGKYLFVK